MHNLIVPQVKTLVNFNRSEKLWQAIDRVTEAIIKNFTSGQPAKREAQLFALSQDWPELGELITATIEANRFHPEAADIEKRCLKAGLMLQQGNLLPPCSPLDPLAYNCELARCLSEREKTLTYAICWDSISNEDFKLWCSCTDFTAGDYRRRFGTSHPEKGRGAPTRQGQTMCKHIFAYLFAAELAEPDQT